MGDEDKQFEASAQKLKRAREEGQVVKSKDLSTALMLVTLFSLLFLLAPFIWNELARLFVLTFEQIPNQTIEKIGWQYLATLVIRALLMLIGPFMLVAFLVAAAGDVIQVGPLIATKAIMPKFDKLNPVNGFKNIFSKRTVVELVKNLIKIAILGYVAYMVFSEFLPQLMLSGESESVFAMFGLLGKVLSKFITMAAVAFLIIAGADYGYQRFKFLGDQKMSFKEMKDEYKQQEGDPMVKHMLRHRRMQLLQKRMLEAVPQADVVTTNPIHVAVALKYTQEMEAPAVVAKGAEVFAEQIKTVARQHGVPIVENPLVARTLYKLVDVDREIPPDMYQAVAEILMFAWRLRGQAIPLARSDEEMPNRETPEVWNAGPAASPGKLPPPDGRSAPSDERPLWPQ
ncbi:MAG: flagellar biosynthesis protein FlhB [Candidatus Melainabacteria bacterium]|nr:flagellar biosynthesis protein FlhB [Candidatus Melainabacteria bacterium]